MKKLENLPKLIFTDIDGVWTDGGMYYDQTGNELKKFHTYDAYGVTLCKRKNIPVVILTGEDTNIVLRRAEKLEIDYLYQGVTDKLTLAKEICKKFNIELKNTAFIGDDLNDIELLNEVGFSASPPNAPSYIKNKVDYITELEGGKGAFRDFIEYIFLSCGKEVF